MYPIIRRPFLLAVAFTLLVGPTVVPTTAHAQSADELAERLATLRAEVEQLSEELTEAKNQTRTELQSLARQKSDLQVELDRETIRVQKLRAQLSKKSEKLAETSDAGKALQPVYEIGLAGMRKYVASSMPFRRVERLGELDKIEDQRRQGVLSYPRALTRLWAFIEDEFRMTRESAAFQQSITVDGEDMLTDVIRVGMVMLFFKSNERRRCLGALIRSSTARTVATRLALTCWAQSPDSRRRSRRRFWSGQDRRSPIRFSDPCG